MITSIGWAGSRSKYIVHFPYLSPKYKVQSPSLVHREALAGDGELEADLVGERVGTASGQEPSELFDVELGEDGRRHRASG